MVEYDILCDSIPKILIVDDTPNNIIAMKKILSELKVELYTASSGEEALKAVIRHQFAVIYLDVQMPEMDGYEVASCLAQNVETANIPIVFLTALSHEKENILKGYEVGAIDYLLKPIDPNILIAKTKIFIELFQQRDRLEQLVEKLNELANFDSLTGLSNRYQFNVFFEKVLSANKRHGREFALLLLDLDNFKSINDTYGHDVGDLLLREASSRLKQELRESDFISRLGGDEFAILLSELKNPHDASRVASAILKILSEPFKIQFHKLYTSTSIGIATFPFAGSEVKSLFKAADIALYRAKEKGKNAFEYYTSTLNEAHSRRAKLEHAIQKAIKEKEIYLLYQPRVDMKAQKIVAIEALARWRNAEIGDVSPVEFIQLAEEMGIISIMGTYLIDLAFQQFKLWQHHVSNVTFSLAINLSPYQFLSQDFSSSLLDLVKHYNIDLNRIEFEVTESIFKGHHSELEKSLNAVRQTGAKFSIDDFGTGYSSLSRLKTLPINILKIDQSFVRDIATDANDAAIVQAIIALANSLGLESVAEGVETYEQMQFLLENGCDIAQGFYFSRPIPADKVQGLLVGDQANLFKQTEDSS